jgi:general secretion pathway protein J
VMAWQGVDGIVRTRNASQQRLETTLRLNTVIAQWDRDIASIEQPTNALDKLAISCDGATLRLIRRTPDGVQVVAWTLRPAENNTAVWERWAGPSVTTQSELTDSWLRSQQLQGNEPGSVRTLTGLSGWQVYFYLGTSWANCHSTGDLPSGVRVVLTFAPGSGMNGDLTRDTMVRP